MKVIICDDEHLARERLVRLVQHLGHQVAAQAANGQQAIEQVQYHQADVILLDIRMPEMNGIECAEHLSRLDTPPAIIFCTAYDQYAIEAFKTNAIAYLLKPVALDDLQNALAKATKLNQAQLQAISQPNSQSHAGRQHITARTHRGLELIPVDDIYYFLADQKYVMVRHKQGQVLIDDTLKDLEQEFADRFIRIHRNALLALQYLEGIEQIGNGQYQIRCKGIEDKLQVSRRHLPQLKEKMHRL